MSGDFTKQQTEEIQSRLQNSGYPSSRIADYCRLVTRIEQELLPHEVIVNNQYTRWFAQGNLDREDVCHFLKQFSVFSNFFIVAQLLKTINAPTIEAMHASKEILMNELGVSFHQPKKRPTGIPAVPEMEEPAEFSGTIEGSTFRFSAAHFEWLLHIADVMGMQFNDIGKRKHGTESTLHFCDELSRIYGSEDASTALGASFAVENWAAAGFWKELIRGLKEFKAREVPDLPLGFFVWHDMVEDQHAKHTWEELEEDYFAHSELNEDRFIQGGVEMLDGVLAFWNGLNEDRGAKRYIR